MSYIFDSIKAACLLEAAARKAGNVHPQRSFDNLDYEDFARAAPIVAEILSASETTALGQRILKTVEETHRVCRSNVNLGIVMLLAPLTAVDPSRKIENGVLDVLQELTIEDAEFVYRAIDIAKPGGMGRTDDQEIGTKPTKTLRETMALSQDRDSIAGEYVTGFEITLNYSLPFLRCVEHFEESWETAIVGLHLNLIAKYSDTLIARKCGVEISAAAKRKAQTVLDSGWPDTEKGRTLFKEFDRWLREDGHRRNPGTTADLVAAGLFVAFRERIFPIPTGLVSRGDFKTVQ